MGTTNPTPTPDPFDVALANVQTSEGAYNADSNTLTQAQQNLTNVQSSVQTAVQAAQTGVDNATAAVTGDINTYITNLQALSAEIGNKITALQAQLATLTNPTPGGTTGGSGVGG